MHAFKSPQDVGTPGYFLILPCHVTSEFGLDIVNLSGYYNGESSDFQQAISHALQRFATPSMILRTFNSPLALRTHENR